MPQCDELNFYTGVTEPSLTGKNEEAGLKRAVFVGLAFLMAAPAAAEEMKTPQVSRARIDWNAAVASLASPASGTPAERSEEHTSELQSREKLVCRLLLE